MSIKIGNFNLSQQNLYQSKPDAETTDPFDLNLKVEASPNPEKMINKLILTQHCVTHGGTCVSCVTCSCRCS